LGSVSINVTGKNKEYWVVFVHKKKERAGAQGPPGEKRQKKWLTIKSGRNALGLLGKGGGEALGTQPREP